MQTTQGEGKDFKGRKNGATTNVVSLAKRRAELKWAELMIGRKISKDFGTQGFFEGTVISVTSIPGELKPVYKVR